MSFLVSREQVAMALDGAGAEEKEIDYLLETEFPGLLKHLENFPDPMEIWRTLSTGSVQDNLGNYWSWAKDGAIEHGSLEVADDIVLLHAEVEKRYVDWPRSFAANLGDSYGSEKEIFIPSGAPIRLLDIDGEVDERILKA